MDNNYVSTEGGAIKIADDVLATIAEVAAKEIEGVAGLVAKMPVELGKNGFKINSKTSTKGVSVTVDGEDAEIELDLSVKYGFKLTEVAENVQNAVCHAVETMSPMKCRSVTVNVMNVVTPEQPAN